MEKRFRTSVEIPLKLYTDIVLLIAEGEFKNLKEAICVGLRMILSRYDEEYLNQLREKHKDLVKKIQEAKSVVERANLRRWRV